MFSDPAWTGFNASKGDLRAQFRANGQNQTIWANGVWIDQQALDLDAGDQPLNTRYKPTGESRSSFYLLSPKVTDSLRLSVWSTSPRLKLLRKPVAGGSASLRLSSAFRAGVLSAAFLVVNFASRELLDIDPEEIEILEPGIHLRPDGRSVASPTDGGPASKWVWSL